MHKRTFLKTAATLTLGAPALLRSLDSRLAAAPDTTPEALAINEDFWASVRADYRLNPDYINLENGYYSFLPEPTLEAYIGHLRQLNFQNSRYLRTVQFENKHRMRTKLSELAGVAAENVIITRNTTESLNTVIGGFPWQADDEAVMSNQDYGAMLDMFGQVAKRYGVVNRRVDVPLHPKSDAEIVETYARAINPRTRLLMVCHLINITGHVLPIRKICDMAHARGVEVMVDGAHSFAHLDFKLPELDCDYYGTSLHKWLSVPIGAGMLYVRPEKTEKIWPLFPESNPPKNDLLRLNHTGTHPCATDLAIADAIDYHQHLGSARKEARLRYLQRYWTEQVREIPHVQVNTPVEARRSCAIANVGVTTMTPHQLADRLFKDYRIWTVAIDGAGVHGVRITPSVYTSTEELDEFVRALKEMG